MSAGQGSPWLLGGDVRGGAALLRQAQAPGFVAAIAAVTALIATLLAPVRPLLVWNASPSSPVGLYAVHPWARPQRGDRVVAWAPAAARELAAARRYLPASVPLVKPVAAVSGHQVCAHGRTMFVDGRPAAHRQLRDRSGRRMPWWSGCRVLRPGEIFLLTPRSDQAFDGRYFGVTRSDEVIGVATMLWPR